MADCSRILAALGVLCVACGVEGGGRSAGFVWAAPGLHAAGRGGAAAGAAEGTALGPLAEAQRLGGPAPSPILRLRGGASAQPAGGAMAEEVGKAFVQHYYNIFDSDRAGLQNLYLDMSIMTFEGEQFQGAQAITQKLVGLPFQSVKHEVITADTHPTGGGGVLVFVCGNLKVDGGENPMKFSQVFCLMPLQGGAGWFCFNDIFRLNYG